jgi:ABC-type sugar transport system ATPase subunit
MTVVSASAERTVDSYRLTGLTKQFPGLTAVSNVDLAVRRGEIHGIIGRNGAGKSVLMSLISGALRPTAGQIEIGGNQVDTASFDPVRAHAMGVSLVPQEPKFAARLSVVDNLFMGRPIERRFGMIDRPAMRRRALDVATELGLTIEPDEPMARLPIESQQLLAFGKAEFIDKAQIVLLDEITASLSRERKHMLLSLLRRLVGSRPDRSYTLISHHVSEILEFCDRVTVMRDAVAVATLDVANTSARELADWIVGDIPVTALPDVASTARSSVGAPVFSVRDLGIDGVFSGVSLELKAGDVVGFAGLDGSGKDEAAEALFGIGRTDAGQITCDGVPVKLESPDAAVRLGIALLPKHRERQAVIQGRSIADNMLISSYNKFQNALGLIDQGRANAVTAEKIREFSVKTSGPHAGMSGLSGGNKQKVLIGRLTLSRPRLFVLNEPTRGVDLATKPEILRAIRSDLSQNSAVVMLSESEDELVAVCNRILVFFRGRVIAALDRGTPDFTVGALYRAIQGV